MKYGIGGEYRGVYVEGAHDGLAHDLEKEFWKQAEVMIGMLKGCLRFGTGKCWDAHRNVHRFMFGRELNHPVREMWPLLSREGKPIWTHTSHSCRVNYHSVRFMIQCLSRLGKIADSC